MNMKYDQPAIAPAKPAETPTTTPSTPEINPVPDTPFSPSIEPDTTPRG